jgi:hypothetical protein
MTDEIELHELVEPDPKLSGDEKETTITMYGMDDAFRVFSAKPTVVRSLFQHDHFEPSWVRVSDGDDARQWSWNDRESVTAACRESGIEAIHAVCGEMPVGCLTVKSKPRSNNHQSSIVSHETVSADAFSGGGDDE